jgi:hypothetical protein
MGSGRRLKQMLLVLLVCLAVAPFARADTPPPQPRLYALYSWVGEYLQYSEDVDKLGVQWIRIGGWLRNGPAESEKALLVAARKGVHFVPTLAVPDIGHGKTMPADEAAKQMRDVARQNVQRYGPGGTFWAEHPEVIPLPIRYWEIWNEPNIEFLTPPEGMLRTEFYARLLKAASEEIRRLDPGAKIVAFNTAGGCPYGGRGVPPDGMWEKLKYIGWRKFIGEVAAAVGPKAFDIVGTHPYTKPASPETGGVAAGVKMLREAAAKHGFADKPIWFTEVGFPIIYPRNQQVRDETQQACFTVRLYAIAAAAGVQQVQLMYIADIVYGPDNSKRAFGVFTAPGKWRPQATALEVMIDLLPDPRKDVETLAATPGGVYAYRFAGVGGRKIVMAWTDGNEAITRQYAISGDVCTLVSMMGDVSSAPLVDGRVEVQLGEAPAYLVEASAEETRRILSE